jgi:tetratricopeptide (TPR) repeat protein
VTAFLALAPAPTLARAQVLSAAGRLAFWQGAYDAAHVCFTESLAVSRALDVPAITALARLGLGAVAILQDDYPAAQACFSDSLTLGRALGDAWMGAASLNNLADVTLPRQSRRRLSVAYRESGIGPCAGRPTDQRYHACQSGAGGAGTGAYRQARVRFEENLALFQELGNRLGVMGALRNLGESARAQGDRAAAAAFLAQSLTLARDLEHQGAWPLAWKRWPGSFWPAIKLRRELRRRHGCWVRWRRSAPTKWAASTPGAGAGNATARWPRKPPLERSRRRHTVERPLGRWPYLILLIRDRNHLDKEGFRHFPNTRRSRRRMEQAPGGPTWAPLGRNAAVGRWPSAPTTSNPPVARRAGERREFIGPQMDHLTALR